MTSDDETATTGSRPTRGDLAIVSNALRNRWPVPPEQWQQAAAGAIEILQDPTATAWHRISAVMLFVDAGKAGTVNVRETLKSILAKAGCQNGRTLDDRDSSNST